MNIINIIELIILYYHNAKMIWLGMYVWGWIGRTGILAKTPFAIPLILRKSLVADGLRTVPKRLRKGWSLPHPPSARRRHRRELPRSRASVDDDEDEAIGLRLDIDEQPRVLRCRVL